MNRVFQVVWSDDVGAWVVVSELASRRRKARRVDARTASSATPSIRRTLLAFGLIAGAPFAGLHAQSLHWDGTDLATLSLRRRRRLLERCWLTRYRACCWCRRLTTA